MMPDLARQLGLDTYIPHSGAPYTREAVTPGTIGDGLPIGITPPGEGDDWGGNDHVNTKQLQQGLDNTAHFNYLLDCLYEVVHYNGYETAGPYVFGGKSQAALGQVANATGVGSIYNISNPFDTDAEYMVLGANFGAAGQAILTKDPIQVGPALSAFFDGTIMPRGLPFFSAGVGWVPAGLEVWYPLQASDQLFWCVNMTAANTNSALCSVCFRRRVDRHGRFRLVGW